MGKAGHGKKTRAQKISESKAAGQTGQGGAGKNKKGKGVTQEQSVNTDPVVNEEASSSDPEESSGHMTHEQGFPDTVVGKRSGYVMQICKREQYVEAWKRMYAADRAAWDSKMFDGVNPMLNKTPLSSEVDNHAVVCFAPDGQPVGIFSMLITKNRSGSVKPIGKQFVVHPGHQKRGIGTAMLLLMENEVVEAGYDWYYIGCSSMSSSIQRRLGRTPYESDDGHDLYKYNVNIGGPQWKALLDDALQGFEVKHA